MYENTYMYLNHNTNHSGLTMTIENMKCQITDTVCCTRFFCIKTSPENHKQRIKS